MPADLPHLASIPQADTTSPVPQQSEEVKSSAEKAPANESNSLERLKLWLDLGKFAVGTVLVGIFSTIINAQIQHKQIELERLKADQSHLSQFTEQAMSEQLIDRIRFAQYFATLTFSEDSRARWQDYFEQLNEERLIKEERLAAIYAVLPDERERAKNTDDPEKLDALLKEKENLKNDVGVIPRAFSSQEEYWNEEKLNSRIVDEATFTWRQAIALDGTVRIPTSQETVQNIEEMAVKLQEIQDKLGQPIDIVRWYKTPPVNRAVGGARNSHYTGGAVDIKVSGYSGKELAEKLDDWEGGMGLYPEHSDWLHLDNRSYRARWGGL
jgi:uncharacterized protein YcbK (DUF882 family)